MATGHSKRLIVTMPTRLPGPPVVPIVLAAPSSAVVSSFDLGDNQKRWVVIGICLNRLLLPVLRDFVAQEIPKHYTALNRSHGLSTQVYGSHLKQDGAFQLNYGSINSNWGRFKKKLAKYDCKVSSAEELGKLYLEPHMAKFTGYDNTCELSAVLGILANASCFKAAIQANAKDVRSKVRNEWGHCNFDRWTDVHFASCFQVMETMLRSLGLTKADEDKQVGSLRDWESKGLTLCMGCPVDRDLMNLITVEVASLEKELEDLKATSLDEQKKLSDALQSFKNEASNFFMRIEEKQREMSATIADNSEGVKKIEKRQDDCSENISLLEERQSNLEATVSSVKDQQASLTSEVGALKIEHSRLDSRVKALEEEMFDAVGDTKIVQVPSRNLCFCGRRNELEAIASHSKNTKNGCIHSIICGLGGMGKTSLAVEFLCQHEKEYPGGIFWISGENNDIFQRSLSEVARQIGTFAENDFSVSLSKTLQWLGKRKELWGLVVDNLDELEMSPDMKRLLTGHWKHSARGHVIITTRREVAEISEETGIEEQCCIELKCLTEDEGIQFLKMRSGKADDEEEARNLVRELGGLPLALDQAGAYIRCLRLPMKEYVKKYGKQKLLLLKKQKARNLVENTSPERLAVHTTWLLNFDHITCMSEEMEIGKAPSLVMQVCAFFGPDDIPYEVINVEISKEDHSTFDGSSCDQAEIVSLLTKFSLFQRYATNSFSVHRLVQEVIRFQLEKETKLKVISCAVRVLYFALTHTLSPASVCQSFVEDAVFSVDNPPSLHLWGKLALHASYLQEHLRSLSTKQKGSFLCRDEVIRIFNEAGIFFAVSQEKVKAQEMQKMKLDLLVNKTSAQDKDSLPDYFLDVPLRDRDCRLISHCMRHPQVERDSTQEEDDSQWEKKANQLREEGNYAVGQGKYKEASELYSKAIGLSAGDHRLFSNRSLCYLKLGEPHKALEDCDKCLSLMPNFSKALQRKVWALEEFVKKGSTQRMGQKKAMVALALYIDPSLRSDKTFCGMIALELGLSTREVMNEAQLAFALMTTEANETLLLHEGEYNLNHLVIFTNLQIVGLGRGAVLRVKEVFTICSRTYFENIVLEKGNVGLVCLGKDAAVHLNHCEVSGGYSSCEEFPECDGGQGCISTSLGKPECNRTGKFGDPESISGIGGFSAVCIDGSSGLIEYCSLHDCGGGGLLVVAEGAQSEVRKCEVYKNHQAGLEAREGGRLVAIENRIYNCGFHGILIGPHAGECDINRNMIFENAREGIYAINNENNIVIHNNDIHHNGPFGISLDGDSSLLISENRIFENGFWGILANTRTSAVIRRNLISGNKCGGIFIGANFSGRMQLESNTVRDHSGPWLLYPEMSDSISCKGLTPEVTKGIGFQLPPGERQVYSYPPILKQNKEFGNEEGMYHPREVVGRIYSGCTFCRRSKDEVQRLLKCMNCHIASYCSKECQRKHWFTHKTLCNALKSRFSITVKTFPFVGNVRTFGDHLKGIGTGPKPKRNSRKEFIVKIQTRPVNSHPLQMLSVYDKSVTVDCQIQSPEVFSIIQECGVLGALHKFTSKKAFFWAMFVERGEKLTIFLDQLAPYQEW
ncbi:uncharacterized protein [Montipora foliosa]|uniref:uncharacterized protein n=1 Tax=Montipora foliosa TaxID=591990 RepID=UPI0035F1F242